MSLLQRIRRTLHFRSSPRNRSRPAANRLGEDSYIQIDRTIDVQCLAVPSEFDAGDGKIHLQATFSAHPREKLIEICRALPIEHLDFYQPGASPEMDYAARVSTVTAKYLAGKDIAPEYGEAVIPRLIAQLERHDPEHLNVLVGPQLEELAGPLRGPPLNRTVRQQGGTEQRTISRDS